MKEITDKELAAFLHSRARKGQERSWKCPDDERLAAYADHQLEEQARQGLEEHLADCDFCRGQVAFLVRLEGTEPVEQVPSQLLTRARELGAKEGYSIWIPTLRWGTAVAATASLALVAALWLGQPEVTVPPPMSPEGPSPETSAPAPLPPALRESPPSVRSKQLEPVVPELLVPAEGSVVQAGHVEFRWRGMPRSLFYEIRVVTAEGDLVWRERIEGSRVQFPAGVQLVEGQKYFVWVRAYLPEGKTAKSGVVGFNVGGNN